MRIDQSWGVAGGNTNVEREDQEEMVFWTRRIAEVVINAHILKYSLGSPNRHSDTLNVNSERKEVKHDESIVYDLGN